MAYDAVLEFFSEFAAGNSMRALQKIISSPHCQYDALLTKYPKVLHALVNYADASVFSNVGDLLLANNYLQETIRDAKGLPEEAYRTLSLLNYERVLLIYLNLPPQEFFTSVQTNPTYQYLYSERTNLSIDNRQWEEILAAIPMPYRLIVERVKDFDTPLLKFFQGRSGGVDFDGLIILT